MAVNGLRFFDLGTRQIRDKNIAVRVGLDGLTQVRLKTAVASAAHAAALGASKVCLLAHHKRPAERMRELAQQAGKGTDQAAIETQVRQELSLEAAVARLTALFRADGILESPQRVLFANDIVGEPVAEFVSAAPEGSIILMENTRFHPGELEGDMDLARGIVAATQAQLVVLDNFSSLHRAHHASVGGIAQVVNEQGGKTALGISSAEEIHQLVDTFVEGALHPYGAVFGGAKVSGPEGKIVILENLLPKLDRALLGGALVYPFVVARYGGEKAGEDPIAARRQSGELEADIAAANQIMEDNPGKIVLPTDYVVEDAAGSVRTASLGDGIPTGFAVRDLEHEALADILVQMDSVPFQTFVFNGEV
ncbi:MAG: phosphoglycerate kinase [Candidatus Saganbacteria bacterium]|nr:phosphoglycerate kinase [Candidatus Saganbacteria bacterium]